MNNSSILPQSSILFDFYDSIMATAWAGQSPTLMLSTYLTLYYTGSMIPGVDAIKKYYSSTVPYSS